jgi:hypothetical protein
MSMVWWWSSVLERKCAKEARPFLIVIHFPQVLAKEERDSLQWFFVVLIDRA